MLHAELHEGAPLHESQGTYTMFVSCCMVWLASPPSRLTCLSKTSDSATCSNRYLPAVQALAGLILALWHRAACQAACGKVND